MSRIDVRITAHTRHYRIETAVDGEVQPRNIFGCRDGLLPLFAWLTAAELQHHAIRARGEPYPGSDEPTIAVGMPSGRVLTFKLSSVKDSIAD
jgi:hypothetical protein